VVRLLVVVDLVVVVAAVGIWLLVLRPGDGDADSRANAVNEGLRGSRPPAGQVWPALSNVDGIRPPVPSREQVAGAPAMLVATCIECRSGDVIGGFLGRLGTADLPGRSRVIVLGWEGDVEQWAQEWRIDADRIDLHQTTTEDATSVARRTLGIGPVDGGEESGIVFLHDTRGRWRSTFFVGQLNRADIAHDLRRLAND
jgi:hypothetical protein